MTKLPAWKACARWSKEDAAAALEELAASGLSIARFAEREGIVPERLYSWRRRLAKDEATAKATTSAPPRFVEIDASTVGRTFEVALESGTTLRISESIDPFVLRRLLDAAERRGC